MELPHHQMRQVLLPLIVLSFIASKSQSQSLTTTTANATDRLSLLAFKSLITDDPSGALASWGNASLHFCRWPGVSCGRSERVTALDLSSLNLTGSISPSITNLTFLTRIDLSLNSLQGEIPGALSQCSQLREIVMWGNGLQGEIPSNLSRCRGLVNIDLSINELVGQIPCELSSLPKLKKLILYSNHLEGGIPSSLGNLSTLLLLDLSENPLAGAIPPSLALLSNLVILHLTDNQLTGSIPPSLGVLTNLTLLDLSQNNLVGVIPTPLWNLSSLTTFGLASNQLHGVLPPNMGQALPRLKFILFWENQFSGPIPASLSNASALEDLQLYGNNFSGTIPPVLGALQRLQSLLLDINRLEARKQIDWSFLAALSNCSVLQVLALDRNMLHGLLPKSFANLSKGLTWLTISENRISGSVPTEIGNFANLTKLDVSFNLLSGTIPASIGKLQSLGILDLSENKLSGEIPATLGNLTQLTGLYLGNAGLSGSIPAALGNCRYLVSFDLSRNKLTGAIPIEVLTISTISRYLSFSNNSLTGPLPEQIGSLRNLNFLDVSWNNFSGEIPASLGECQTLEYLYMEGNFIQGPIPSTMRDLKGLLELDLSRNSLSGHIPEFLVDIHGLYRLNLSFNNFDGEVPNGGVFANLSAFSITGNQQLCGGNPGLYLPTCMIQPSAKKHPSNRARVVIAIVIIVPSLIVIFCLIVGACWMWKSRNKSLASVHMKEQHMRLSYAELVKATDGFAPANLIGVGNFGSVYKGIMDDDGASRLVAVKVLNLQQRGASKSFMAECEALRNIRHRNLVKIITSCSSIDFRGNEFKALVFEFMPNGSLENWLHPELEEQPESKSLNLVQRLNIAIDIASALDYLHHHGQTPIVHCDLKPSNVLIDDGMTAHVADFGLASFLVGTDSKSSANLTSSTGLKGSVGYIPPEYGMANKVSTEGDVYSFGILLLEMFTGRRPTDDLFNGGVSLHKFVDMAVPEQAMDIADPRLFIQLESETMDSVRTHECLVSVLSIGLLCSKESAMKRMTMGDVTKEMHAARDALLGT